MSNSMFDGCAAGVPRPYFKSILDRTGEVVPDSGLAAEALQRELDAIEQACADKPFLVTRAKWMVAIMDKARLAVKADDVFVDWFPDWYALTVRRDRRGLDFINHTPELSQRRGWGLEGTHGASVSVLDASHTECGRVRHGYHSKIPQ